METPVDAPDQLPDLNLASHHDLDSSQSPSLLSCYNNRHRTYDVPFAPFSAAFVLFDANIFFQLLFVLRLSAPGILAYLVGNSFEAISLILLGDSSDSARSILACGLGNCWVYIVVLSLPSGLAGVMDIICSHAADTKDYQVLGQTFNRGLFMTNLLALFPLFLSWNAKYVLDMLGYGSRGTLSEDVQTYLRYQLPSLLLELQTSLLSRFVSYHQIYNAQFYITLTASGVYAAVSYLLVHTMGAGLIGVAIALDVVSALKLAVYYVYVARSLQFAQTWLPFDISILQNWGEFIRLLLPRLALTLLESFGLLMVGFEAAALVSDHPEIFFIAFNIGNFLYAIASGFGDCAGSLVDEFLMTGAGPEMVEALPTLVLRCYYMFYVAIFVVLGLLRRYISLLYTLSDQTITDKLETVVWYVLCTQFTDGLQTVLGGIMKGAGLAHLSQRATIVGYFLVLHPAIVAFCVFGQGLSVDKIWVAWMACTGCAGIYCGYVCCCGLACRLDLREPAGCPNASTTKTPKNVLGGY